MNLSGLSTHKMSAVSSEWITSQADGGKRELLEQDGLLASLLVKLLAVHATLSATRPEGGDAESRKRALSEQNQTDDAKHDATISGVDMILEGVARLLGASSEDAAVFEAARAATLPTGRAVVLRSYIEQGAAAEERGRALQDPAVRQTLERVQVDGQSLASHLERANALAAQISANHRARLDLDARVDETEVTPDAHYRARLDWVRVVRLLLDALAISDLDDETRQQITATLRAHAGG